MHMLCISPLKSIFTNLFKPVDHKTILIANSFVSIGGRYMRKQARYI